MMLYSFNIKGEVEMSKEKGSQFLLAEYVNHQSAWLNSQILKSSVKLLNEINDDLAIEWISPLKQDNYKEYRDNFLNVLGVESIIPHDIWPKRGPVWDGLAKAKSHSEEEIILLVEAKAHLSEMKSELRATSLDSVRVIQRTFQQFRQRHGIDEKYATVWENGYYQLANRIIYLDYLNHALNIKTYLVLINFVDDPTHVKTSLQDYLFHYKRVFHDMGISHLNLLNNVILCYI